MGICRFTNKATTRAQAAHIVLIEITGLAVGNLSLSHKGIMDRDITSLN